MKLFKLKYLSILFFSCLLFTNCRKEKSYWDDNLVAPIAHGGLKLSNLFPDTTLKSNPDSSLKIAFEASLINYRLDSLLKIPDTTITTVFTFSVPTTIALSAGTYIPLSSNGNPTPNYYNLPNGIQMKKAVIRQGEIKFTMKNTVYEPLAYHYKLISATKNSKILDTIFHIPKADSVTGIAGTLTGSIDLTGYTIDFTGINHNTYNTTVEIDSVHIDTNAKPGYLHYNQGFNSQFSFTGMVPQYALGYFGDQTIKVGPDTTSFNIFKTIRSGMLNLSSATANLRIVNEFGVPMRATINSLSAISTANGQTVTIGPANSTPLAVPININAAINNGNSETALPKTILINSTNTPSLTNFIGILPDKLSYKLSAQINPSGNTSLGNDFGYYGTAFKAYLDADIPLNFSASNLVLGDTVSFNLNGVNQLQNINRGQLILTATNEYPFAITLQGYLLDGSKNVIDVLFDTPNVIQEPMLDASLKVVAPLQTKLTIPLNKDKISKLQKTKYIYYKAVFNTASQPNRVKFYNYYNLDLLLTADINYTIGK
ncbi:MAG TPA: hypothetical protein VNY73_06115 [Bacteroidia bacterium]|nr:hypothetical protein [Bacteroidia bacterium]